jgi:hypothetical protein
MSHNSPKQWFNLEERFFSDVDNQLIEQLRNKMSHEQTAEGIMRVTGLTNEKLAAEIAAIDITVETLAAFRLAPLVAVAWADDRVEESERYAIIRAAEKSGITSDDPSMALLENWTRRRPPQDLLDAWCDYAKVLSESLDGEHRQVLKKEILEQVRTVAEASGGFLGFGAVSPSEKAVIAQIQKALS